MSQLAYDVCRCAWEQCWHKNNCARYMDKPPDGVRYPVSNNLCGGAPWARYIPYIHVEETQHEQSHPTDH